MPIKKLQAREIVREAKRLGIEMKRMDNEDCIIGVIAKSHGIDDRFLSLNRHVHKLNLAKPFHIDMLEAGFEGWATDDDAVYLTGKIDTDNRYYKVGQNVARLVGLSS